MAARMRLSKTAREKLKKEAELYEQTCYFIAAFGSTKLLDIAYLNVYNVSHDLDVILSSSKTTSYSSSSLVDDVSSMIIKSRSKVENELIYICEKTNVIETKQAFQEFLLHFKQGDITKYRSKRVADASLASLLCLTRENSVRITSSPTVYFLFFSLITITLITDTDS
ncbi:hypothetical protein Tco_0243500 [Tanacetum coccineum]